MKRNWEIIRKILLQTEALPVDKELLLAKKEDTRPEIHDHIVFFESEFNQDEAAFNAKLMAEEGMIKKLDGSLFVSDITWKGCEILDVIRYDSVWDDIKSKPFIYSHIQKLLS